MIGGANSKEDYLYEHLGWCLEFGDGLRSWTLYLVGLEHAVREDHDAFEMCPIFVFSS